MSKEIHKALINSSYLSENDLAKIRKQKILIIGAGGICHPFITYACSSGFQQFTVVDDDLVEESNLSRQFMFTKNSIGKNKVQQIQSHLNNIYSDLLIHPVCKRADEQFLFEASSQHDVVVDCSDNFHTRYLISDITKELKIPLLMGFAGRDQGQVFFTTNQANSPCYECIFPKDGTSQSEISCSNAGIVPMLLGIVGSYMNMVLLNYIHSDMAPKSLTVFNLGDNGVRQIRINQDSNCSNCYHK